MAIVRLVILPLPGPVSGGEPTMATATGGRQSLGARNVKRAPGPRSERPFPAVSAGSGGGLGQLALHLEGARAQLGVRSLEQPVVETADMFDRTEPVGRNAELE